MLTPPLRKPRHEIKGHLPALDRFSGVAILMVLSMHLSEHFLFLSNPWKKPDAPTP